MSDILDVNLVKGTQVYFKPNRRMGIGVLTGETHRSGTQQVLRYHVVFRHNRTKSKTVTLACEAHNLEIVRVEPFKAVVHCEFIRFEQGGFPYARDTFYAVVIRTSDHPKLGPPKPGKFTTTSKVLRVDFEHGVIETLNTLYVFKR